MIGRHHACDECIRRFSVFEVITCVLHLLWRCIDTFLQLFDIGTPECIPRLAGLSRAEANIAGEPNSSGFVKLVQPDFTQEKQEDEVKHARLEANKGIVFRCVERVQQVYSVIRCRFPGLAR